MKNISIILPIHKFDEDYSKMMENAISSISTFHNDVKLLIVCPNEIEKEISKQTTSANIETRIITSNKITDFCGLVNLGATNCDTEWFSILEVDDEYKAIWLKSMNEYIQAYPEVSVFLPIVKDINSEGEFISFTNESVWAYGFSEKQGFLENEILLEYQNYQISGGLYRTKVFIDNGLLKENIKLTFGYELFLRLTYNDVKIMTIPRVGYQHVNFREDSLFWNYKNQPEFLLSENEASFWIDTAKREFFFKNKRDINYVEN
jgi:hypothetical protein